ncbi:hypothetical protein [Thermosulfurimonas dismutans]|uniref:Uncharacterized protein n=1 Tax=Thermosulfurimonas dismutans TaxID=999894 RepID=A0A179D4N4_9BACT|nr:hypothetical protein [Thermosulfurimonas dismutans]OAQ21027.1 hypothetical protein TDIS_0953 [Thermosulfurimonas dismutans]
MFGKDESFEAFLRNEYWAFGGYERPGEWEEEEEESSAFWADDDPFDRYAESLDLLAP